MHVPLMSRSHHSFCPVPTMQLLGIMFKIRSWSTTFHIITVGGAEDGVRIGRCDQPLIHPTSNVMK